MRILVKDQTSAELFAALEPFGASARTARRLQAAVLRGDATEIPTEMPEVSPRLLARVRAVTEVPRLKVVDRVEDPDDGFVKYALRGTDDQSFEAVRIPLLHQPANPRYVVCVSSQAGCALDCKFCATAKMGFRRNLETWEIVDQVARVRSDSMHPVRGVVFMGMGEPMLNYDRVMRAARILSEPCGMAIAAKAITVSTVGVVPAIRRFTRECQPFRLVVSLSSADPERRRRLLPIEDRFPLTDLIESLREYHESSRRRVTLAWTMIAGVNTRRQDAVDLARITRGLPIKVDLIDVNDPSGKWKPPSDAERDAFRDALREAVQCPVDRRYSGGRRVHAACGMLANRRGDAD